MAGIIGTIQGDERTIITNALDRFPRVVGAALTQARGIASTIWWRRSMVGQWTDPLPESQWWPFSYAFELDRSAEDLPSQVAQIRDNLSAANGIVISSQCHITRYPGSDYERVWGYSRRSPSPTYEHEIQLGGRFFNPLPCEQSSFRRAVAVCGPQHDDIGLLRICTLIHEAMHCHNGRGEGNEGHEEVGPLRNPYNYEYYLLLTNCSGPVPRQIIQQRRRSAATTTGPTAMVGPRGTGNRTRQPGPVGIA